MQFWLLFDHPLTHSYAFVIILHLKYRFSQYLLGYDVSRKSFRIFFWNGIIVIELMCRKSFWLADTVMDVRLCMPIKRVLYKIGILWAEIKHLNGAVTLFIKLNLIRWSLLGILNTPSQELKVWGATKSLKAWLKTQLT